MNGKLITFRPPRIAMALLALATIIHWLTPLRTMHVYSSAYLSAALLAAGFLVMMWAWWQFREHEVAICPTQHTAHLITDGIYRYTRNPMYLGIFLMLLGVATFVGTPPYYAAAMVFLVVMDCSFCRYEEAKLAVTFGREYEAYKATVRRWI